MMLRLAEDVEIHLSGTDGAIDGPGNKRMTLPGCGARLRTLAALLRTPRSAVQLQEALAKLHPDAPDIDFFIRQLESEGVLLPWALGDLLGELHRRMSVRTEARIMSPAVETAR